MNISRVVKVLFLLFIISVATTAMAVEKQSAAIPVVADLLLGGWMNGSWVDADTIASHVPAGLKYSTYSFDGRGSDCTGSSPRYEEEGCEYYAVDFADGVAANDSLLAVGSRHDGMLRRPKLQTGGLKPYEELVARYLKNNGISAEPEIQQLVRVDLDGDGSEEVLIVAGNADSSRPVFFENTYSLVLFRRLVAGKVITEVLHQHYYHEDSEGMADSPSGYKTVFAVDINGDGSLELILRGSYYEGFWYEIYEFTGKGLKKVLSDGLGA
ncbi:MAG: hypothetical protein GQF41_0237 [Candidatus Rifleibacterium amylolyticum]|nr:MAG: hypothetical protein GQF41_0237 [Candidatus Rifleibacterium amylolyticum]